MYNMVKPQSVFPDKAQSPVLYASEGDLGAAMRRQAKKDQIRHRENTRAQGLTNPSFRNHREDVMRVLQGEMTSPKIQGRINRSDPTRRDISISLVNETLKRLATWGQVERAGKKGKCILWRKVANAPEIVPCNISKESHAINERIVAAITEPCTTSELFEALNAGDVPQVSKSALYERLRGLAKAGRVVGQRRKDNWIIWGIPE